MFRVVAIVAAEPTLKNEHFGWLPRWIVRELEDYGPFSWRAFLIVGVLCLLAYFLLQRFGGLRPGLF